MKISIGNWNILNMLIHTLSCTAWIRLHAIKEKNSGSIKFGRRCSIQTLLAIPSVVMKPMCVHWSCQTNESYICHSFFAQSCSLLWCTKEYGFELGLLLHACHSVFTIYFQAMFGEARALWFFLIQCLWEKLVVVLALCIKTCDATYLLHLPLHTLSQRTVDG